MNTSDNNIQVNKKDYKDYSISNRAWAGLCHNCSVCPFADKKPQSMFGKAMRWHRTWCPGWANHTRIYGRKPLS
jgi:hypothetical protein